MEEQKTAVRMAGFLAAWAELGPMAHEQIMEVAAEFDAADAAGTLMESEPMCSFSVGTLEMALRKLRRFDHLEMAWTLAAACAWALLNHGENRQIERMAVESYLMEKK